MSSITHSLDATHRMVESDLRFIIAEISRCRPHRIKLTTKVTDHLGVDSFTVLEILVALEAKYEIKLSGSLIRELSTFGDLVSYVCRKINKSPHAVKSRF